MTTPTGTGSEATSERTSPNAGGWTRPPIPLAATAWLAGPPELRGDVELLDALLTDLLALLEPYPIDSIYSSEPRTYRMTPRGRALLKEALAARRVDQLILTAPAHPPPSRPGETWHDDASASVLVWAHTGWPDSPVQVQLAVRPVAAAAFPSAAMQVTEFVTKWFAPLRAAAAFVSVSGQHRDRLLDDSPMVTGFERGPNRAPVYGWSEVRRYARGVFWGMGLGHDLCARLGGAARVLREAPVPIARPLGDGGEGMWLQVAEAPPAEPEDLEPLAAFLTSLLDWSVSDLQAMRAAAQAEWQATVAERAVGQPASLRQPTDGTPAVSPRESVGADERNEAVPAAGPRRLVPIRGLRDVEVDATVNLYLATPATPDHQATLRRVLATWYMEGFEGKWPSGFGAGGFHSMSDPVFDGRVARFSIDLGSADGERALRALARRLATLPDAEVRRMVLGTESVG